MSSTHQLPPAIAAITEDVVATLGKTVGLDFPRERLPLIAQRLRELHLLASELDSIDLGDRAPAVRYDPSWTEGGAA